MGHGFNFIHVDYLPSLVINGHSAFQMNLIGDHHGFK
jgi:hypothetical protein